MSSSAPGVEWPDYVVIGLHFTLTVAVGLWVSQWQILKIAWGSTELVVN